jgi:tetratricopeptide (TPR) repeat protein
MNGDDDPLHELAEMDLRPPDEIPVPVFRDLLAMVFEVQQDGDDETGYRLRLRAMGAAAANDEMALFVRRENGSWLIRGATNGEELNGFTVLGMAAKGELEPARKWLNWTREDATGGTSDDPLDGDPFAALWPKSKATATIEEIRLAAASLATDKYSWARSEPILVAGREQAASEQAKAAIDLALVKIYQGRKDWPRMLEATSRLVASNADSATAFSTHIEALLRNGKASEATALAQKRLERLPGDRDAVRALALSAAETGDYTAAQQYAVRVVDELRPKDDDFTHAAWIALFTGNQLERAIEHAQRASQQKKEKENKAQPLPALAALYAETGRSVEARTALLQGIDDTSAGVLHDGDWYVLGRIAENYGVDDYAITAYRKVGKKDDGDGAATVTELAQRRLAGLVKKKE